VEKVLSQHEDRIPSSLEKSELELDCNRDLCNENTVLACQHAQLLLAFKWYFNFVTLLLSVMSHQGLVSVKHMYKIFKCMHFM